VGPVWAAQQGDSHNYRPRWSSLPARTLPEQLHSLGEPLGESTDGSRGAVVVVALGVGKGVASAALAPPLNASAQHDQAQGPRTVELETGMVGLAELWAHGGVGRVLSIPDPLPPVVDGGSSSLARDSSPAGPVPVDSLRTKISDRARLLLRRFVRRLAEKGRDLGGTFGEVAAAAADGELPRALVLA